MNTVKFEMVGRQIELAPTPIATMTRHIGQLGELDTASEAGITSLVKLVMAGVKRANKDTDLTEEWLLDNLDTTNMGTVFDAFVKANGFGVMQNEAGAIPPTTQPHAA